MNKIQEQMIGDAIAKSLDKSDIVKSIYNSLTAVNTKMNTELELPSIDVTLCYLTSVIDNRSKDIFEMMSRVSNDGITLPAALHQEFTELRKLQKLVVGKFKILNEHLSMIESGSYEDAYSEAMFLRSLNGSINESVAYLMAVSTDNVRQYLHIQRGGPNMYGYNGKPLTVLGPDLELTLSSYVRVQLEQKMMSGQMQYRPTFINR